MCFGQYAGDGGSGLLSSNRPTIAIVDAYDDPNAQDDLNAFSLQFGLPQFNGAGPTFSKIGQTGTSALPGMAPIWDSSWELEESLDVEWAHAIAPQANIVLVEANNGTSFADIAQAVSTAANYPGVVAVSMSFSWGEFSGETTYDTYFTTPSGHAGVTFLAASGDSGAMGQGYQATNPLDGYPAFSRNVVAVGGTSLHITGRSYSGETGWAGSGGGVSQLESPQPTYQSGVVTQSTTRRTGPDVSMDADPWTGVAIYDSYDYPTDPWINVAGTSLAAPMWAGLIAIVAQGRALAAGQADSLDGATQTLPGLYSLPSADFHDITSGNNGYAAGIGYDLVTGLGSPIADKLIPDMVSLDANNDVVVGAASKLGFPQQPTSTLIDSPISPAVIVAVQDDFGHTITTDNSSSVTLTLNGGTFADSSTTVTASVVNGVATFSNLVIDDLGTNYTLTGSDGTLTGATSQVFAVGYARLVFTSQPTAATAGATISPAVTVTVEDYAGNTVSTDESTVTLTLTGGTFAGGGTTATATAANGIATFNGLIINAIGNYTLTASDDSLTEATSGEFTVSPSSPYQLCFSQQPTETVAGTSISTVSVAVEDEFGNTVTNSESWVAIHLSIGTFASGGSTAWFYTSEGVATCDGLAINKAGSYTLSASDDAIQSATLLSGGFNVIHAGAAKLVFTQQPTNTQFGSVITPDVTVAVEDNFGNLASEDSSTVAVKLDHGAFFSGGDPGDNTTAIASCIGGVATFSNLIVSAAGNYTLTASDGSLTEATSGSFLVCPLGDTDHSGGTVLNAADIDAIYAHFGASYTSQWKVYPDTNPVGQDDVSYELTQYMNTNYADANLDQFSDFTDFQIILDHWQATGGWADGDFNGDTTVDFLDFQKLLDYWNPLGWAPGATGTAFVARSFATDVGVGVGLSVSLSPSEFNGSGGNIQVSGTVVGRTGDTFTYAWSVMKDGLAYNVPGLVTDEANLILPAVGGIYTATLVVTNSAYPDDPVTTPATFTVSPALDTTFGTGGLVLWNTGGSGVIDVAKGVAVQQVDGDTKTVVVGYGTGAGHQQAVIARFNSDGTIDSTFGDRVAPNDPNNLTRTGWTKIDLGAAANANAVAIDSAGRIFVGGYITTTNGKDFLIACYTSDGVLDTGFGTGGVVVTDFNGYGDIVNALTIEGSGSGEKIIAGGYATESDGGSRDMAVAEYTYSNQSSAVFATAVTWGGWEMAYAVGVQSGGKIVLCGNDQSNIVLERFTALGVLDTDFGNPDESGMAGATYIGFGAGTAGSPYSMMIDGDNNIVIGGQYWDVNGADCSQFLVARILADGTGLDTSFGAVSGEARTGYRFVTVGGTAGDQGRAVLTEIDGSIVVAGTYSNYGFAFAQFSTQGDLTSQYSSSGGFLSSGYDQGYSAALEPDGSLVIAGTDGSHFVLARYVFQLTA